MKQRIPFQEIPQGLIAGFLQINAPIHQSGLDPKLIELVNFRVSQINGCAFCLDMHHKDAIHLGETEQRLHGLPAWRESPYYTEPERAALAFAELLTIDCEMDDATYAAVEAHFPQDQVAALTVLVAGINAWNRINKSFRPVPGHYKVGQFA